MEIVNVDFLKKNRKYSIPLIFISAAILTPPDVITQLMAAVPLIILYEIGVFITGLTKKKKEENWFYSPSLIFPIRFWFYPAFIPKSCILKVHITISCHNLTYLTSTLEALLFVVHSRYIHSIPVQNKSGILKDIFSFQFAFLDCVCLISHKGTKNRLANLNKFFYYK